jgi:hypothetical protein
MVLFPIEFLGTPREIGFKRGRLFRDTIRFDIGEVLSQSVEEWSKHYNPNIKCAADAVRVSKDAVRYINSFFPELVAEMKGVAEGAGVKWEEYLLLGPMGPPGCTNLALTESNVGPILGDVMDGGHRYTMAMLLTKPEDRLAVVNVDFRYCRVAAAVGMNEKGLAMGSASVPINDPSPGIPLYLFQRALLERCATVEEAIVFLKKHKIGYWAHNDTFIDRSGDTCVAEIHPKRCIIRRPEDGGIFCTNHYVTETMHNLQNHKAWEYWFGKSKDFLEDCLARDRALSDFMKTGDRNNAVDAFKALLRTHGKDGVGGFCHHSEKESIGWNKAGLVTTFSSILIPAKREIFVTQPVGYTCKAKFINYKPFD